MYQANASAGEVHFKVWRHLCFPFQTRYDLWRRILKTFWAVVVGYSMVVLIAIYMYQFRSVSGLFRQIMGMSEDGWAALWLHAHVDIRQIWWHKTEVGRLTYWYTPNTSLCEFTVLGTWVWNGMTRWSCLHVFCFLLPSYWPVSSSCTTSTQTSWLSQTSTAYLWDRPPGEAVHLFVRLSLCGVSLRPLPQPHS